MSKPDRPFAPIFKGPNRVDDGIARAVRILWEAGVETFESCEGGTGHSSHEPIVRFHGVNGAGLRALGIALEWCLPVSKLSRCYYIDRGEPTGPTWELEFVKSDAIRAQRLITPSSSPRRRSSGRKLSL